MMMLFPCLIFVFIVKFTTQMSKWSYWQLLLNSTPHGVDESAHQKSKMQPVLVLVYKMQPVLVLVYAHPNTRYT